MTSHYTAVGKWNVIIADLDLITYDYKYATRTVYDGTRRKYNYDGRSYNSLGTGIYSETSPAATYDYRTEFVYDALGRLKTTILPVTDYVKENGSNFTGNAYTHIGYDPFGRKGWQSEQTAQPAHDHDDDPVIEAKELLLRNRYFNHDAAGKLTSVVLPPVTDPEPESGYGTELVYPCTEYEYDNFGNPTLIRENVKLYADGTTIRTDARDTTFSYDKLHNQISRTLPDSTIETKEYDDYGRIISEIDGKGQEKVYSYYDEDTNIELVPLIVGG